MKASCQHLFTVAVAAFFASAMVACSSGSGQDGGTATASAGSTSGGQGSAGTTTGGNTGGVNGTSTGSSTGGACSASGVACGSGGAVCCTGLVCSTNGTCQPCGTVTEPCCAGQTCDTGLTCLQSGGSANTCDVVSGTGGTGGTGGCTLSQENGPCLTLIDCNPPNVCVPANDGGGYCTPLGSSIPSPACIPNGGICPSATNAKEPCCGGSCVSGTCVARTACALQDGTCTADGDCCNDLHCAQSDAGVDAGKSCQPTCGANFAPCGSNSDCCVQQGLICVSGNCGYASNSSTATTCVGTACASNECLLGSACTVTNSVDPCAPAGLVCDANFNVCRAPGEGDACQLGGPACQPLADSTVTDLQCLSYPGIPGTLCLQPCGPSDPFSGTADCINSVTTCKAVTGGAVCFFNEGNGNCGTGTSLFGTCKSEIAGDSYCAPDTFNGATAGICLQGTLDGGEPGAPCYGNSNRQIGGFCNPGSLCLGGVCAPNCNAGTSSTPACAQPDAGLPEACLPSFG
ncbi:MAG TPA: hypothetical protein VMB50_04990, partial [Myxococcales bacterium]|nr:hypothetical protein [Myxococcales bacterium]